MTPEERAIIRNLGNVVINNFANIVTGSLLQGIFTCTLSIYFLNILQRGFGVRATKVLFILSIIGFFLNVMGLAAILAVVCAELQGVLIKSSGMLDEELLQTVAHGLFVADILTAWSAQWLIVVIDCVVVWRAWVLYFDRRWIMILPVLLLAVTFGLSLAIVILGSKPSMIIASDTLGDSTILGSLENASLYISLATNVLATLLILWKFWEHRKVLRPVLRHKKISGASRALRILIEADVLYIILEAFTIFSDTVNFPGSPLLNQVADGLFQETAGMYPIIVTLLIHMRRSEVETLQLTTLQMRDVEALPNEDVPTVAEDPLSQE